ncbi:substrate-binding domain-containing protein [Salinarimonas ramus]|uniref:Transcriptional regulator n=1 Tax=Salinarimonas ramus TaxID=690164 RepID=A0A917Q455_9HYPH|nr:substrate-binding domain-containing protein [Salinarimonas ramus]GGK22758.1 transcriptional regulator [Salinarimonas ramus]
MNLRELAAHLGLSQTTVSRALNGYPDVAEATRRQVMDAARQFNYRPNPAARRLATGRAGTVAILFPVERNLLVDPHFFELLAGLADMIARTEMELSLRATPPDQELDNYRRLVNAGRVDGFVLSSPTLQDPRIPELAALGAPFVVHGRTEVALPYAYLDIDNEDAFARATALLLDLGHVDIALLNGDPALGFAVDRERGFRAALAERGLAPFEGRVRNAPMTEETGYRSARALLERPERPTAILASSVLLALGVYRAARDLGLAIGRDVSVIAHDDALPYLKAETFDPPLATTLSPIRHAGYRLGEMLIDRIAGVDPQNLQEILTCDLVFRASVAPLRGEDGPRRGPTSAASRSRTKDDPRSSDRRPAR